MFIQNPAYDIFPGRFIRDIVMMVGCLAFLFSNTRGDFLAQAGL